MRKKLTTQGYMAKEEVQEELGRIFKKSKGAVMNSKERRESHILIVDQDASVRHTMRQSLLSLGFACIADVGDHSLGLQKLEESEKPFTHIIFDARSTKMPAKDFLLGAMQLDEKVVAIPSSYEPTIDDVFDLLIAGARGYICKPFTSEALDETIVTATNGDPLSDALQYARTRNEALASVILSSLSKLAMIMRQARKFQTARREVPMKQAAFRRAIDIGHTFAKGGSSGLREAIIKLALERADKGPSKRVGRFRKRAAEKKEKRELLKDPKPAQPPIS